MGKDPLCPLGFHPQVRWPTRCKRCFRDIKEHTVSNDSLRARSLDRDGRSGTSPGRDSSDDPPASSRTRARTPALSSSSSVDDRYSSPYSSISSTAYNSYDHDDYRLNRHREGENSKPGVSVVSETLTIPTDGPLQRRRRTTDLTDILPPDDSGPNQTETVTIKLKKTPSFNASENNSSSSDNNASTSSQPTTPDITLSNDSETAEKKEDVKPKKTRKKRLLIQGVQEVAPPTPPDSNNSEGESSAEPDSSADVAFIIQVKSTGKKKKTDDDEETMSMTTATDTTETTLIDLNEMTTGGLSSWEVEDMKIEVKRLREKCDRLEKEKTEILTRRVSSLDAPRVQSGEYTKLQQKVNQLTTINEDLQDELKHLRVRERELEGDLSNRPTADFMQRSIAELRSKLSQSETQIDKLQEEKRDAIKQMKDMQEEFEEMQDSFREEQAEEFASLKRELDEASKNCRLLQFKLRKVEKRCDQVEAEKKEVEQRLEMTSNSGKIAKLEDELKKAKQENERLKTKDKDSLSVTGLKKKSPVLTKAPSGEKVEPPMPPDFDPHKTLRDLQSALERESDLREQFKFAEEEAGLLRQKISRIEEENESLLIQIKKMSSRSRTDLAKGKVETGTLGHHANQNDIGEKLDANELKLQLELNEQESKILRKKVEELEKNNTKLAKDLRKSEDKLQTLEHSSPVTKSKNVEEVSLLRRKLIEKEREIERLQTEMLSVTTKNKGKMLKTKSLEESSLKAEVEAKAELKRVQEELTRLRNDSENQRMVLEDELAKAQQEVDNHQLRVQQMGEANKHLLEHVEGLKRDLRTTKEHYESMQSELAKKNAKIQARNEEADNEMERLNTEYNTIQNELKALRETFNNRQDTWIKEKLSLEQKVRESEDSTRKLMSMPGDRDATKLKALLKQQQTDLDNKAKELGVCQDRLIQMQKDNEELKRQLDDFDKVAQVQMRSLAGDTSKKSDKDLKALQERLTAEEKIHKNEVAQMKMKQDHELAMKNEEISTIQSQLSRAKRERDTFRQMVDSAQRAIAELKSRGPNASGQRGSVSGLEEAATGAQAAMKAVQERVASLEDELAEARRETSRVKTEIVTEKSQWEMTVGEMQQKINELEEEKMLSGSGRSRGSNALSRTRLELAWQKEREEQQRRLKEATTLARDLKTTLLELERGRDRDRTEAKRRIDQIRTTMEEEQEELKRKVQDSQNDLLELRDAHAKLRTGNEKLRKDREKLETQRELQIKRELESRKISLEREKLLDQLLNKVAALNPTASNSNLSHQPPKLSFAEVLHYLQTMKSLKEPEDLLNTKEKRRSHFTKASSLGEDNQDIPRSRESLQSMPGGVSYGMGDHYGMAGRGIRPYVGSSSSSTLTMPSRARTPGPTPSSTSSSNGKHQIRSNVSDSGTSAATFNPRGSLYRKALSLEQTVDMPDEKKIWKGTSDAGSGSSIASTEGQYSRGSSMERTSTKSDKSKSLMGKMKKFVKSKSIEEPSGTAVKIVHAGVQAAGVASNTGSDLSINSESGDRDSRGTLRDKVKGMFKRSSRSPSTERKAPQSTLHIQQQRPNTRGQTPQRDSREGTPGSASTQRPLMPSTLRPVTPSQQNNRR